MYHPNQPYKIRIFDNFSYHNQNGTSILRQSTFGVTQPPKTATSTNVDTTTLVKSVVNDMTSAEKGGQWLLSCYAPFKEKPAFPGFEDQSFEEIRLAYYEARKNGTVEQYKQQIQLMLQQAVMKSKSLQAPSPDIVNILKNIYNTPPSSQAGTFGNNTSQAFSGSNISNTVAVFGQQQTGSSLFAQGNQSVFGKTPQTQGTFGQHSSSIFGGKTQPSIENSPFSSSQTVPQTSNSIFGQSNANYRSQHAGPIFGGQPTTAQPNTSAGFATSTSVSIFGVKQAASQPQQGSSIFGQQQSGSIFGSQQATVQPATASIFGAEPRPVQPGSSSIFGGSPSSNNSIFASSQSGSPSSFVSPTSQQMSNSPFAAQLQAPQANNSVFASSGNPAFVQTSNYGGQPNPVAFSQASGPNIFGAPPNAQLPGFTQAMPQPSNIFGANQPANQTSTASIFSTQSNVFAQTQNAASPFNSQGNTGAQNHSASIFGNNQQIGMSNSVFGQPEKVDESLYSKLEDLTEEEIKWFESDDLDILNIPEKPPTYQMCFKV